MQNNRENGFWAMLMSLIKVTIVLALVYAYFDKWISSYREKNWKVFIIMSIIPALMFIEVAKEIYNRSQPNAHRDMFDAQFNAWKSENNL